MIKSDRLVACVRIPELPIQAEIARRPYLADLPFVVGSVPSSGGSGGAGTVGWCSKKARNAGIRPGMPMREVPAVCREAMALSPDFDYYAQIQDAMLDALEAWAPVVEEGDNGSAYIDLTGMDRLYPDRADLLAQLASAVSKATQTMRASAAAGPNKFVAHMAALGNKALRGPFPIVTPSVAQAFLAPFPVHTLPISDEAKRRLSLFGLETLGQIAALSACAMESQFGPEGRHAWELACGIDRDPVVARRPFRPIVAAIAFPVPTVDWASFWIALGRLISSVWQRKERRQRTVRQVELSARTDEDDVWERSVTFHEPIGDRNRLEAALRRRLEGSAFPGAVVSITLKVTALGGTFVGQETLFADGAQRLKRIKEAISKVKVRHGTTGLYRIAEVEPWSRIPERRYALIDFEP